MRATAGDSLTVTNKGSSELTDNGRLSPVAVWSKRAESPFDSRKADKRLFVDAIRRQPCKHVKTGTHYTDIQPNAGAEGMKRVKVTKTYYLVSMRPRFRMPKDMVSKFKSGGYKWVQRESWVLEKADCLDLAHEQEFIKALGEQQWEITVQAHVGQYSQKCQTSTFGYTVEAPFYDPMFLMTLQVGWCPKCKAYTLRTEKIEQNERFDDWERQAEEATDVFLELLTECRNP